MGMTQFWLLFCIVYLQQWLKLHYRPTKARTEMQGITEDMIAGGI